MFKNHHVRVSVEKNNSVNTAQGTPDTSVADTMYIVHETGKKVLAGALVAMTAWVVLDTARQVTVNNTDPKKK